MRNLTDEEQREAPNWAFYYSISSKDSVFFVNESKTQSCSLASPNLGIIELKKRSNVYNNLMPINLSPKGVSVKNFLQKSNSHSIGK